MTFPKALLNSPKGRQRDGGADALEDDARAEPPRLTVTVTPCGRGVWSGGGRYRGVAPPPPRRSGPADRSQAPAGAARRRTVPGVRYGRVQPEVVVANSMGMVGAAGTPWEASRRATSRATPMTCEDAISAASVSLKPGTVTGSTERRSSVTIGIPADHEIAIPRCISESDEAEWTACGGLHVVVAEEGHREEDTADNDEDVAPECMRSSCDADASHVSARMRRRAPLPKAAIDTFEAWARQNWRHPYPSDETKLRMSEQTGVTVRQVTNWFINFRKRKWSPTTTTTFSGGYRGM
ncbi:hypothetical protein CDCA_CDCA09G2662 [Cyanidium caldarium]|uniref:Homeobox domain-containing protein n=1 Tax=Cyanidium caldarium TaxID=2771 RepID=A0AAV9IWE9_CYACA|nr:hypothetical protein CDCA_CDCA09G2662 [Cyanidium caldarium]